MFGFSSNVKSDKPDIEVKPVSVKDKVAIFDDVGDDEDMLGGLMDSKYFKKYLFSIGAIVVGLFMGSVVTLGIFAGLFAALGTCLSIERLKDSWPEAYNWMIDHPGWVEVITTVGFASAFGFTATGVIGGLVANMLSSVVIDYYTYKEGRIPNVDTLTLGGGMRKVIDYTTGLFKTIKYEVKSISKELKSQNKEEVVDAELVDNSASIAA